MIIKKVDVITIRPRLVKRAAAYNAHFPDWNVRTVWKITCDNGLIGYGEHRTKTAQDDKLAQSLVGKNPFDFIGNKFPSGLGGALYDVMGKYLDVPAYKLMGQKVRDWVSVAAWTKPASPDTLRQEVKRAVAEGYTIMKMHTCEFYDVIEQTKAVEEVAPPGFKMHYDFNWNRTMVTALPILQELEKSRVVGFIEDPLPWPDFAGWRNLRERSRMPIIMMVPPFKGGQEIILGLADAYMTGGSVGDVLKAGAVWAGANIPGLIQITGGTLTKALTLHLAAVMPTHTMHSVNLDDQYEDDIVRKWIPVVEGSSPVPEGPGLGVEVDEEALAALAANPPTPVPKHVAALRLKGGHTIYYPSLTTVDVQKMTGKEEGTIRGLELTLWDDDGSAVFQRVYDRVQKNGPFIE